MPTDKQLQDILNEASCENPTGPYAMTYSAAALRVAMRRIYSVGIVDAAKVAEEYADKLAKEWRAGHKSDSHLEGQSDGADDAARLIMALNN